MAEASLTFEVGPRDTAAALGSGDVPVLATPRLLAWCEAATVAALAAAAGPLADGPLADVSRTSVGTRVELEHLAATAVGGSVTVTASVEHQDGRLVRLAVAAVDAADRVVGTGHVTRVIVDRERFLARVPPARP